MSVRMFDTGKDGAGLEKSEGWKPGRAPKGDSRHILCAP